MMWLALAAQLSLPTLRGSIPDVRAVFSADDFPAYLQMAGVSRAVFTRTIVRPDGSIQSCVAEATSGDPKLDAFTCAIIVKRAKFRPATWVDGTAAYGVGRVLVQWVVGSPLSEEASSKAAVADVDLSVNRLPKGARSIVIVRLQIAADERGHPVTCAEVPPVDKADAKRRFPELVPIACQQAMAGLTLVPVLDDSRKPVRSVQNAFVRFKLDH
jgi:hypothetical protein